MMIVNGTDSKRKRERKCKQYRRPDRNSTLQHFDLAGNNLTVNQTNLISPNLTIDHTNPTLSNLTIYSNNHNTSLATLGNTLNITITANENLSSANITLLNSTHWQTSVWFAFTVTLAFAIWPVMFIAYVEFRSVIFALERFSFAVIVMFRVLPKVASEVLYVWVVAVYG